jgi:hypothetical protein
MLLSSPLSFSMISDSKSISVCACKRNGFLDLIIFIATSQRSSWSYAQTTWPNDPLDEIHRERGVIITTADLRIHFTRVQGEEVAATK